MLLLFSMRCISKCNKRNQQMDYFDWNELKILSFFTPLSPFSAWKSQSLGQIQLDSFSELIKCSMSVQKVRHIFYTLLLFLSPIVLAILAYIANKKTDGVQEGLNMYICCTVVYYWWSAKRPTSPEMQKFISFPI